MPIADALREAQEAVVRAETAVNLDIGTGEASALLGTAQATVAYQLVMQILRNKVVELAPALIAVEIAAINGGIAAYLAEQELSMATERDVETKTDLAFEQVQSAFETDRQDLSLVRLITSLRERIIDRAAVAPEQDVTIVIQKVFDEVDTAIGSALEIASTGRS